MPALGYSDPVKGYADYRASAEGGSYDTLVVNVQQLFDQFNYGESSPLAIYQFMKFLSNVKAPRYLLLIGRGLDPYHTYYRTPSAFTTYKDLVPSAGYPGADMAFTAGLAGTTFEPAVPTGRIPALKPDDVAAYLNKVKEMEQLPYADLWRKNILHLSGGIAEGEPELFKSYMQDFQSEAEDYHLGGKVSALAKYSKDIQHINVAEQVNNGVNLITFFGHSSATTTDFDIGYVSDPILGYNNKGKYPMLLMNGCNVGSFFIQYTLFGEDWVLAKDKGATGFIGHSAYGFNNLLKKYTDTFYEVAYQDSSFIRQGIGDIQKETARRYMQSTFASADNITQVQQMVLLGDPAVKLFGASKPDLEINCRAQLSILEACRRYNPSVKVVFAGTRQVYGRPDSLPVTELHLVRPTDVNGINKAAGEYYHLVYNNVFGVRACSLRLTNVYGPRQLLKHNRQGFIGWFIRLAIEGRQIPIYGDGSQMRDFVFVDDAVDAFLRAGATDACNGEVFNVGGGPPISHRDLVTMLLEQAGHGSMALVEWPADKKAIDIGSVYSSSAKLTAVTGWKPTTELADGLARTIAFYRAHFDRYVTGDATGHVG
jgi:nucleoside-diphosphate-sugar epimerase